MSQINNIINIIFEMQSLEDMMQSYQQAIVTDPIKLAKLQMKDQNLINNLIQQDPGQVVDPNMIQQQDPGQVIDPNMIQQQDPNQIGDPSQIQNSNIIGQ